MWKIIDNVFRCMGPRYRNVKREMLKGIFSTAQQKPWSTFADPVGAASPCGRQPGKESFLRNERKFLQPTLPPKMQEVAFSRKAIDFPALREDHTQPFLYRDPKLVMLHRRNAELDYQGNVGMPLLDPSSHRDCRVRSKKRTQRTEASKVPKKLPVQLIHIEQSRSYAQMIADYSESLEKHRLKESAKQSPRGLLSRFVPDSMLSSIAKFDLSRSSKGNVASSNSTSLMSKRYPQESKFTLSESKGRKSSPNMRNSQKRDYVTKQLKNMRVEETWGSRFLNNSPKLDFEHDFDFDFKAINRLEREKENITARWVQAIQPKKKALQTDVSLNDSLIKPKNEKIKIKTSADKIEIEIPITSQEQVGNALEKKVSILNVQISAKALETVTEQNKFSDHQTISCLNKNDNESNCCDEGQPRLLKKANKSKKEKGLPWWASSECTDSIKEVSKTSDCLNEVYPVDQNIKVIATEDISSNKVIKVANPNEARIASRPRRRRKTSSISKVTKHIQENLLQKKLEINKGPLKKNELKETENTSDIKDDSKKDNNGSKQSKPIEVVDQEIKACAEKVNFLASNHQHSASLETSVDQNSLNQPKSNLQVAENVILAKSEKSNQDEPIDTRRKGKGIEYRSKRIPDILKPIEKREDGTLIDYGLKVPTRKPRLKRPTEKSTSLPAADDKAPKKTISAPQNELSLLKTDIPVIAGSDLPQKNLSQTKSELPLMKQTPRFTKANPVKEESDEQLQQVQDSLLPEKFKSKLPKQDSLDFVGPERMPNRGDNAFKLEHLQARTKVRERLRKALVTETTNTSNDERTLKFLEVRNKIRQRLGLPLMAYDPLQGYSIIPHSETQLSLESDQSDKELIYSAWLNRFHTRRHDVLIK